MATIESNQLTMMELAKRTNDGALIEVVNVLTQNNAMLIDAPWQASNGDTSHKTTRITALPVGTWRQINKGVDKESSKTTQIEEPIGLLEGISHVDEELVNLAPNKAAFRATEDLAYVEGISQTLGTALAYGSRAGAPEQIDGLATRYNLLAMPNVTGAGGTGADLSSVWIVQWGPRMTHLVYPRNIPTIGITMRNNGLQTVLDADGKPYKAYETQFKVRPGLVVRDDRNIARICNVETAGTSNIFDPDLVMKARRKMPNGGAGAVIYANSTILAQMDVVTADKVNVQYAPGQPYGMPLQYFQGIPVRQMDAILDTESAVV